MAVASMEAAASTAVVFAADGTAVASGMGAVAGEAATTPTAVMAGTAADGMATGAGAIMDGDQDFITVVLTMRTGVTTTTATFVTITIIADAIPTATTEIRDAGPSRGRFFVRVPTSSKRVSGAAPMLAEKTSRIEN